MLRKLLKYDLKWCFKPLIVFYILSLVFAVLTRIIGTFNNSLIFIIIGKICTGAMISMLISILINNFMRVWVRVIRNLYKDESYLTHTIPVSKTKIFLSKVLTAIITTVTSCLIIVISLAICYLSKDNWQILKSLMEQTAIYFNSSVLSVVITMIITIFFEILFMEMAGILGILIGHRSNNFKILKSIIAGFILYTILSMLTLGIIYLMGLFNPNIMKLFTSTEVIETEALKKTLYGAIIMYVVYNVIYYFIGKSILEKGVNVE